MDHIPVFIRKDLELDMAGMLHEMFDVHRIVPERHLSFLLRRIEAVFKFFRCLSHAHPFAVAAEGRLDDHRIADLSRCLRSGLCVIDRIFAARYHRHAGIDHRVPRLGFIPQTLDDLGLRADKCNVALLAQLGELAVL